MPERPITRSRDGLTARSGRSKRDGSISDWASTERTRRMISPRRPDLFLQRSDTEVQISPNCLINFLIALIIRGHGEPQRSPAARRARDVPHDLLPPLRTRIRGG